MRTILLALLALCIATSAFAAPLPDPGGIKAVRVVGPAWESFTNTDGTGLYHEILMNLFALYGIEYRREYVPSERAYHLVRGGQADFMTCHDIAPDHLQLAKHPMFEGKYYVFFNRKNIEPWSFPESLEGRTIAWRIGYYDEVNIPAKMQARELKTGVSALGMVILGRLDFYLDDLNFIQDSMRATSLDFDMSEFRVEPIGSRTYHPVFNRSERGQMIMELYDKGIERLLETGKLKEIFEKWGFPLPDYRLD